MNKRRPPLSGRGTERFASFRREKVGRAFTMSGFGVWLVPSLLVGGCGGNPLQTTVVHGEITFAGQPVEMGRIRFVPIGDTAGPASHSRIVDGRYRIAARGGVPVGRHRVEIEALRKTGRQVKQYNGFEEALVDETEQLGPPDYAGADSPLTADVPSEPTQTIDFNLPAS